MEQIAWYQLNDLSHFDTPALAIYTDRVKQNITSLVQSIDDVARLRPHVKTHKTREATRLMLEAGIRKFKCATISEAEMLAICGAPDVLLAYQPNPAKMHRLLTLIQAYQETKFSCLVDNITTGKLLSEQAEQVGVVVPVYIDLNVGMNRTGITPDDNVVALYTELDKLPGVRPVGLHAYDGHMRNPDIVARTVECDAAFEPVQQVYQKLKLLGYEPIIVVGGSPSFPIHARREGVECSPGTFVYWDKTYSTILPEQPFIPAVLVVARVISLPGPTKICVDLGHKSIAAESPLEQRVTFLNAPELKAVGQSEEHLVLEAGEGHTYQVGDVLYGIPNHVCPTCALYERGFTIEDGNVTGEWRTISRDRILTY